MSDYLALLRARWIDVVVPVGLVLLALIPFMPVFGSARLVAAALGGAVLGTIVATLGAWRRWTTLTVVAATLGATVLGSSLGAPTTALAGIVPTPQTLGAVGSGAVTSWKQIVTLAPPLGAVGNTLTAPYLLALLATLVAVTVSLRTHRPAWALLAPAVVLAGAILLGTAREILALPLALVGAVVGLLWATWRTGRLQQGRPVAVLILVAVAAAGGTGVGLLAPGDTHRVVLREIIEPPLDPHDYPSPLAGFRAYLKDHREDTILTVSGLPAGAPVRLATMDAYDGTTWAVAGSADGSATSSGTFTRIGERVEATVPDDAATVEVELGEYAGVWLPTVGRTYDVEFAGPDATETARNLYFNRASATGIVTSGLRQGDSYSLLATPVLEPPVSALEGAPLARVDQPELSGVPEMVVAEASTMVASAETPLARVQALVGGLQEGYFSHGLEGDAPSLAGHGAARLAQMVTEELMIGDEEQYAALMGLLGRAVGLPTRVVMGFAPQATGASGPVEITGDDVTAWVEVAFEDHGWVPFYPTPDEDRIPQVEEPEPQDRPQPQVLQPPPPAQEPPDAPPMDRDEVDADEEDVPEDEPLSYTMLIVLAAGGSLLLLLLPLLLIVLLKLLRRRRRRTRGSGSGRVAGGWDEVVDRARDLGVPVTGSGTRHEQSRELEESLAGGRSTWRRSPGPVDVSGLDTAALARHADAGVFGPVLPDEGAVAGYWEHVESTEGRLREAVGPRRWLRSRISLTSLRKGRDARHAHPAAVRRRARRPHGDGRRDRDGR
ncbi:Transglutaminase-like superfamily protein [Georgenia satyanarayanai]|uniref:Transglutaminase-like superfamily protein n=1 Tax=Georgenia satyanarayanai TaxID=860221 RepID=A0A2Y8ZVU9_9MICO|nr:transglutaminase domain-containing protein [Georgenia satyanarayanai]PYG01641.1 transglutaminase superfamily protein [Georgenia satyanarayanai]SSA36441.1 Transglutaminase-like superfamily protein [Georgenia satyanarayanai]